MRFVIHSREYEITKESVQTAMMEVQPRGNSKYQVRINDVDYPTKQVIEKVTGLPPLAFTTAYAYRILDKLGFKISVME